MDYSRQRDFTFCKCGTALLWLTPKQAKCPFCKSNVEVVMKELNYHVTSEYVRRELKTDSIVEESAYQGAEVEQQKANETCPKCKHHEASYQTRQMRSADEGQTVIYTCLKCSYTWSHNT